MVNLWQFTEELSIFHHYYYLFLNVALYTLAPIHTQIQNHLTIYNLVTMRKSVSKASNLTWRINILKK